MRRKLQNGAVACVARGNKFACAFALPVATLWAMTIDELIERAGSATKLAKIAGVHRASVSGSWQRTGRIPVERAHAISEALKIPLHEIRPDVWRAPSQASAA